MPRAIGDTIEAAVRQIQDRSGLSTIKTWIETDIAGRFVGTEVLGAIASSTHFLADVTVLNFNVTYEIGYAIGLEKPLVLVRNAAIQDAGPTIGEVGVFDTLGYRTYENSSDLSAIFRAIPEAKPIRLPPAELNRKAPVYVTDAKFKTDPATRIIARVKKARLGFRSFDPNEQPRLSGPDAIRQVAQSFGILVHFVPNTVADARVHNLRSAFLAGLSHGMGRVTLLLQNGDEPVPIDYRDLVVAFYHPDQIDESVAEFATRVTEAFQVSVESPVRVPRNLLEKVNLGASSAENELRDLAEYYLEINAYQRALRGDVRVVVGRKGSGKSAIFHRVRDRIRSAKGNIVLDLKPEGYKLLKFKEDVLRLMTSGTLEHTVTAFWEYLLLLEICYKILEKDRVPHTRDPRLFEPYRSLAGAYDSDLYVGEGDFSERLSVLLERIGSEFKAKYGSDAHVRLSEGQLTELLYVHDVRALREQVERYLQLKDSLWLLFDNIDKGWPAHGIQGEDLVIIRALLEATRKIERQLERHEVACRTLVFLRNDVYELLVQQTPDRARTRRSPWTGRMRIFCVSCSGAVSSLMGSTRIKRSRTSGARWR
ncbi:MAG: hypothetical protein GEV06_09920 [Luteitalea sp.]|nr:hypothetical protein [Luteitalea sp.]